MRRFINSFLGCAFLFLLAGTAQAQLNWLPMLTAQGCTFFHPFTSSIKEVTLAKMADRGCKNGKLDGDAFYGSAYTASGSANEAPRSYISMRGGLMVEGQFDGLYVVINQGGVLVLVATAKPGQNGFSQRFERETPQYSLQAVLDAIAEMAPRSGSRNPAANREYLQGVIRLWDANPYGMMKEFTDPPYRPTVANPGWAGLGASGRSATGNAPSTRDDLKTIGRGARGG